MNQNEQPINHGSIRQKKLLKGVWSAGAVRGLSAVSTLVALPLAVRYLGPERYGIWITISSTVSWINILDLGISDSVTNKISASYAKGDQREARIEVSNALSITAILAIVVALVLAVASRFLSIGPVLGIHDKALQTEAIWTAACAIGLVLLNLVVSLNSRIFAGYQEVGMSNLFVAIGTLLGMLGMIVGVWLHWPMYLLLIVSVGAPNWVSLGAIIWLLYFYKPWLAPRVSDLDRVRMLSLLRNGFAFFIIKIAGVLAFGTDNLIISHYVGASEVTPYAVTWRLAGYAGILQSLVFPALWPAYTEAYHRKDYVWLKKAVFTSMATSLAMGVAFLVLLVSAGQWLISHWAGRAAVPARDLLIIIAVWNVISGVMSAQSNFLGAIGVNRLQSWLSLFAAIANIFLSTYLVQHIGVKGVVIGTISSYLLILVVPQSLTVWRCVQKMKEPESQAV